LADLFRHACVLSHRQGWVNLDEHRWVNFGERYSPDSDVGGRRETGAAPSGGQWPLKVGENVPYVVKFLVGLDRAGNRHSRPITLTPQILDPAGAPR